MRGSERTPAGAPCQARPGEAPVARPGGAGSGKEPARRRPTARQSVCVSGGGAGRPQGRLPLALPAPASMPLRPSPRPLCSPWAGGGLPQRLRSQRRLRATRALRTRSTEGWRGPAACAESLLGEPGLQGPRSLLSSREPQGPLPPTPEPPRPDCAGRPVLFAAGLGQPPPSWVDHTEETLPGERPRGLGAQPAAREPPRSRTGVPGAAGTESTFERCQ